MPQANEGGVQYRPSESTHVMNPTFGQPLHTDSGPWSSGRIFAEGTDDNPVYICGDAGGGADTHSPKMRRVGLGFVIVERRNPVRLGLEAWGPLPGRRQTVYRGELAVLEYVLRCTRGAVVYLTDNEG
eukprot:9480153-Pyramimonas_sp.AAC.1